MSSSNINRRKANARSALLNRRKQRAGSVPSAVIPKQQQNYTIPQHDPSKPREERHFKDFYKDLEEDEQLPLLITDEHISGPIRSTTYKIQGLKNPEFKQIPKEILPNDISKIPKNIIKLGYKEHSLLHDRDTYIREHDYFAKREQNNQFFESISQNQINFKSTYDMDEQDNYFLSYLNSSRIDKFKPILHEIFEIVITILENEWYYLEKKIPPKIRKTYSSNSELSLKTSAAINHTKLYGADDGIGFSPAEDQRCAVCNESECDNSNAIIFCDGCDIAVHQDCYGVIFIPEGQWLCRRCMISKKRKTRCLFCPSTTGAFKQTDNGLWSHVLCALWIPELYFASAGHMEPVEGFDAIPKGRWKLNCYICKQKMGACIQCANRNCFTAFHPTCARRAGLFMEMKKGVQGAVLDKSTMHSYCHKHSPQGFNEENDVKTGIEKTRLYFETINQNQATATATVKIDNNKKTNNNLKKWKTSRGTPIPPNYFIKIVSSFLTKLKVQDEDNIAQQLVKYWCMKREMKRGAPLIRRTDPTSYTSGDPEELTPKLDFCQTLLKDIDNLQELSTLIESREAAKVEQHNSLQDMLGLAYFPHNALIQQLLTKINQIDSSRFLLDLEIDCFNLSQINEKSSTRHYQSLEEFLKDLSDLFSQIEELNTPVLLKAIRRISRDIEPDLKSLESFDHSKLQSEFILKGLEIDEAPYKGLTAMEEEDLSDIDVEMEE
ncbi:hypothetical protein BN7_4930 [Wickerhamomyces ciferrii]|uniref:NuA3 HAT complex component NTO1 n=1 Tax=Wickerhamomyces ciferrii (strain ATCC 14091 / BCRC 22168 / CBS 111 / JCM 3599 / NBRC 0793 / NRRL Y-1031 F-60-10) TaxID=1206466 RepID=K0KW43_WICCF|nr:uncharacterized protein BN7_4930 [Wickerhamomyces ciferrii]CCH45348.1 hypothetical protein BN7_4930 [Wickerhamomyces ciferrii]